MREACILLSTYNGEKYLEETLISIEKQQNIAAHIFCRDDGSTDGTLAILERYRNRISMDIELGSNIGSSASFDWLLRNCKNDFMVYALCDQDDIWARDKLSKAISAFRNVTKPGLLVSGYSYFSKDDKDKTQKVPSPSMRNALIENNYLGATMVMSRSLLLNYRKVAPEFSGLIDSFINLFSSLLYSVIFLDEPLIAYRLHEHQQIGLGRRKRFFKRMHDSNGMMLSQILNTKKLVVYVVNPQIKESIERHLRGILGNLIQRIDYLAHPEALRDNYFANQYFKILVLVGFFRRRISQI